MLAEDPVEANSYPSLCEDCQDCQDCKSVYEHSFPIDGDLIEPLINMCFQELLSIFGQMREDKQNDSRDTIRPEGR